MIIKYVRPLRFAPSDFTPEGAIRPFVLLHIFQDVAGTHAAQNGMGFDDLIRQNLIWVITKLKYKILSPLRPDMDYRLESYPRRSGSLIYDRDFYILDSDGRELVIASSQWCVVDFVTRHVAQTGLDFPGEYTTRVALPEGIERLRPRDLTPAGCHTVTAEDLDANEHTNNCRYADMALQVLGLDSASTFTISFANETRLGDEIELYTAPGGVAAGKHDDAGVFTAKAE